MRFGEQTPVRNNETCSTESGGGDHRCFLATPLAGWRGRGRGFYAGGRGPRWGLEWRHSASNVRSAEMNASG